MVREIKLPEIAENVSEGRITTILVSEGESIQADQDILEMETDKASVEVPAPFGGTVQEILVGEGDEVSVGQAVMKVEADEASGGAEKEESEAEGGREPSDGEGEEGRAEERGGDEERGRSGEADTSRERGPREGRSQGEGGPQEGRPQEGRPQEGVETGGPGASGLGGAAAAERARSADVPASPATRRLARELGVDITQVDGSGPGGRISSEDVKAHARRTLGEGGGRPASGRDQGAGERETGESGARDGGGAGERRERMTRVRALTAERTTESWQTIPHVTQHDEADLTGLNAWMDKAAAKVEKAGGKLTVTAVLTKLVAQALRVYPRFNASADMDAGEIIYHDRVAVGIAADTERGLLVPVVRDPDRKSVTSIAIEIGELAKAARSGDLEPSQMQGATFSLSNLGGIGGTAFTPVIVPPAVAILGVARAQTKPVYDGRSFVPHEVLPLSLSYDHRVIDGADGARFVVWIKTAIEDPFAALMEGGS
ncbi:MAG: 2-oxo acid dehydrogenase subunit E2 [Spirochaetota bacterium]